MGEFNTKFTTLIIAIIKVLLIILIGVSFGYIFVLFDIRLMVGLISVIILYLLIILIGYKTIKAEINERKKLGIILLVSFILRMLWLLNVNSVPTSDFNTMYEVAGNFLKGDYSMFWGTSYIARFPHLTGMVLYMALMRSIFPTTNLIAMKIVNLGLGVLIVFLVYLIIKEIFQNKKYALYGALVGAILPSLVTYTAVFCSENIAIPFYLISVYLFFKGTKIKNKISFFVLSGVLLGIGNLFRSVATVVLIAYVIYMIIYFKDKLLIKFKITLLLVIPFYLIMFFASFTLHELGIIENTLTKGSEPSITNVLKGTNIENGGRWNEEDASLPEKCDYDYDLMYEKSKEIIIDRLTNTDGITLSLFFLKKFAMQWNEGDYGGVFWSQLDVPEEEIFINISGGGTVVIQVVYVVILILVFLGTLNRKEISEKPEINLIYLILCGYGGAYLITESQGRYSYIVCWVFIILAIQGIDYISKKHIERKV